MYIMMHSVLLCILLLVSHLPTEMKAQEVLSIQQAISIALESNYGVQITRMQQEADQMQVYRSNAGFGPSVDWNANLSLTGNNVNQTFIDDSGVSKFGRAINPSTNIALALTLFDGGRMKATYDRLGKLSEFSMLEGKIIIQNTIIDVMATYYDILRQRERVTFLNSIIKNYEERLKITEERWQVGRGSKLDYLQSKTDLNAQLSSLVTAQNDLRNAKVRLNGLLNRDPQLEFEIVETTAPPNDYNLEVLQSTATQNNRDILLLQKAMDISLIREKEVEADRAPQVALNSIAGFTYANTNAGFLKTNRTIALTAGVSARWNLFDGHHRKNQIAIAKINTEIIERQSEQLEAQIINDLNIAYNQYRSDKELLTFEILNKDIAEENLNISLEKFRLGGSTILELNEAQRAYDTALDRLVNAQFSIKVSELELLRLSGSLVE